MERLTDAAAVLIHRQGFATEGLHGFVSVVPAGFHKVAYWQGKGHKYINPLPVKDVRHLDQPQLKK